VVEGGPTAAAPVAGPDVDTGDCDEVDWLELDDPEEGEDTGLTGVGVAAVVPAAEAGTVGAEATGVAAAVDVDAVLVGVVGDDVAVGVEVIVEAEPVVSLDAFAWARVVAVTISPLPGLSAKNDDELGSWMLAAARAALASARPVRNPTACGGGITMPIDPASCSTRWSSPSVATLSRSAPLRLESTELRSRERPMLAPSFSTSTCIATMPASMTPSNGIQARPRTMRSSNG
jgi:hypothetical protein